MSQNGLNRRLLIGGGFGALAMTLAHTAVARTREVIEGRLARVADLRRQAIGLFLSREVVKQTANGDEDDVPERRGCFTKGLPHDSFGRVDEKAYRQLLQAIRTGKESDFERIPLGGPVKLANPQAAFAADLLGPDGEQLALRPAPKVTSKEQAAELTDLYWMALLRDVPFRDWPEHPWVQKAKAERTAAPDRELFRLPLPQGDDGPYVSQFLLLPIPWRPIRVEQRIRTTQVGLDFQQNWASWLAIQNGGLAPPATYDREPRFVRSGRDLAEMVHRDFTYQIFLGAAQAALRMGALPDGGNPYKHSRTQSSFVTFGEPYLLYLLATVTQIALKVCWFQKWRVHRRVRPEELGGLADLEQRGRSPAILDGQLLASRAFAETLQRQGNGLLTQAYPEGCPLHPAYPSGHAVVAGACTTVLKALLDQKFEIPDPVEASTDGRTLLPYAGKPLTLGNELDKLASNVATGRSFAGIHWMSDNWEGLLLGEKVALAILEEQRLIHPGSFDGYDVRTFAGDRIRLEPS